MKLYVYAIILIIAILLVLCINSLLFSKRGTWSTFERDFKPRLEPDIDNKFESAGEKISRTCLENYFQAPFKNQRLEEIKNPNTGRRLEIDCFNRELKIGLEYHGKSHYKFVPFFHKTVEKFAESQENDEWKRLMCQKLGIFLIIVPYTTRHANICSFIKRQLKHHNYTPVLEGWNNEHQKSLK